MKTIAVIGPEQRRAQTLATQLMRCRVKVGAGPQDNPDGVIAVVGEWSPRDQEVVDAVSQAMGALVLYRPSSKQEGSNPWPQQPGVYHCTSVAEVQSAVDSLFLNRSRWYADARRADLEREDRVRIAVRLEMRRVATSLAEHMEDVNRAHERFVAHLQVALLRHGLAWPTIETTREVGEMEVTRNKMGEAVAVAAGLLGGVALGFGLGRVTGQPLLGLLCGVLVAAVGAGVRVAMVRTQRREADLAKYRANVRESWMALVADVMSRAHIPRVHESLAASALGRVTPHGPTLGTTTPSGASLGITTPHGATFGTTTPHGASFDSTTPGGGR
ncbi:hypothetical protein [Corynebacterium anserum]|uniref:Uncharacterized protein n=1 Tax=Corynebacterium anserum TaxID=2684406 RepID=A0A7G7YLP1_9CORY|nr:hypothetical protein [Corynebacterium anserum]MBC2681429.1 hypothetical protein [Corynebacterium anserum]QNH95411.1 hypothetical protein GP473_00685 [Corynebacterium anserum]